MNDDKAAAKFMNSSDMEEAIVEKARTVHADAWQLALDTEDEDLFENVWKDSTRLVLDDIITGLIEKGLMEVAGMTEDGDMSFMLSPLGREVVEENHERP